MVLFAFHPGRGGLPSSRGSCKLQGVHEVKTLVLHSSTFVASERHSRVCHVRSIVLLDLWKLLGPVWVGFLKWFTDDDHFGDSVWLGVGFFIAMIFPQHGEFRLGWLSKEEGDVAYHVSFFRGMQRLKKGSWENFKRSEKRSVR